MARISNPDFNNLTKEQQTVFDKITAGPRGAVRGPLAVWLSRPGLADSAQALGQYCRYDSSLSALLSELAILVTARIWDAAFEWQAHVVHAQKAGLDQKIIDALAVDKEPVFKSPEQKIVYQVARDLNINRKLTDAVYEQAESILGKDRLVDLIGVLGYYALISMTINAFEVDPLNATKQET